MTVICITDFETHFYYYLAIDSYGIITINGRI